MNKIMERSDSENSPPKDTGWNAGVVILRRSGSPFTEVSLKKDSHHG